MNSLKPWHLAKSGLTACGYIVVFTINAAESPALRALGEVESGNNDNAIGAHGERSRYQLMEATWYTYADKDFVSFSTNNSYALEVASSHLVKLGKDFSIETKRIPTQNDLYIMYNCGFEYYKRKNFDYLKCPRSVRDRAERFANLCTLYQSNN